MKNKVLLITFICILFLSGCKTSDNIIEPQAPEKQKDNIVLISQPDFTSQDGIREYLVGKWIYDWNYYGDVICKMDIDKDLNVNLSFENSYSDKPKGDYRGKITFDRMHANPDQAPDLISLELMDTDEFGGDFYFLHRTIYDGKRAMSWFFAGNGNTVFDVLDFTGDYMYTSQELIFEKVTGEKSQEKPRKGDEFYAVYWGKGSDQKSMWLDDVWWTPAEEELYDQLLPAPMTHYDTDVAEGVLYNISPEEITEILGEDLTRGGVYFVETDQEGNITYFIDAERKRFMEDSYINPEAEAIIYHTIENGVEEIKEYLNSGMSILLTGETEIIEDEECYLVILGTDKEESFVREIFYAINIYTLQVYKYDVLMDRWEALAMG